MALTLKDAAGKDVASAESALAEEIGGELALAAIVIDAATHTAAPAMETVS